MTAIWPPFRSAEAFAAWSQIATLTVAVIAAAIAIFQIRVSRRASRETSASGIFRDYMRMAFDNPRFANPGLFPEPFSVEEFEKYEWFVGMLLWACDEVLRNVEVDKSWSETIEDHLKMHETYLASERFRAEFFDHHDNRLKSFILRVCAGTDMRNPHSALQAYL